MTHRSWRGPRGKAEVIRPQFAFDRAHAHIRPMRSACLAILAPVLALAATACSQTGVDPACFNRTSEKIGGPFSLTSHTGARVTEDTFKGRKTMVFFGFTHCPDVCPNTLYAVGTAMTMLPKDVKPPMTAFISVDPARDTPAELARYIESNGFPSDITGLTGTLEEVQQVADAFGAPFSRVEDADSASGYLVDHMAIVYLMDENWKLATYFPLGEKPEQMAQCIAALK
jgi:protein SCO1/2